MDFHGLKRKDLQILCKKHGIPANLKNIEMVNRLASLFQKEDEETVTETKISPEEDSVEADDSIEEEANLVASRKAKKVRFSPETDNQVFEFTRSVKKNVRTLRSKHGTVKSLQKSGDTELRRSKRCVSKGTTVNGSNGDLSNSMSGTVETEKGPSNSIKVTRRSKRVGNAQEEDKDTDLIALEQFGNKGIHDGRRSTRLAAKTEKSFEESGASKPVALSPVAKRSKRIGSSCSTQEEGMDTDLNAPQLFEGKDIQDGRRSRRLAAKTEKSFEEVGRSKSVALLPPAKRSKGLVDLANKEEEKETGEHHKKDDDSKVEMVRRRSRRFANDIDLQTNTQDQRRPVRLKASVANPLIGKAKNDSVKVKGNLVDKKMDGNLVKSSKRVTRNMKRDRSKESGMESGTASNQSNLTPKKTLDEFTHLEQEEACGADVKAGGSSKKSKIMNQECIKDKLQGIIIIEPPSSCEAKAAESGMLTEKVSNPTQDKAVDSPERSNIGELNCEPTEGECEEKLERGTVSMPVMEEDKEEISSCSLSSPKDKLHVSTGHIIVKDIASTVIAEESTKTKDEPLIYAPEPELKEHSSITKLANVEEIQENSTERWKDIHSNKDDEKGSLEKDVQAENLHENVSECNTENSSAEEESEITKIGVMSVAHCVNLTPEKPLGEYAPLVPEEAERPNVEERSSFEEMKKTVGQEIEKDKAQGMPEDSPSTSETKATEPVMISENVLDSTRKVSGDTSAVRNSHELNSELLEEKREEKHERVTFLLAATEKDEEEASSLSEFLIERSEVKTSPRNCSTGCSPSVETTLPPASVQLAMSNPEADLGLPTDNDIDSTVITEEDKITKEETLISIPTSVAKLTKVEAILGISDEKGSLEKDVRAETMSSSEEEMETSKVGCMSVDLTQEKLLDAYTQLVPEEAGEPNVQTVSSEFVKENPQGMAKDSPSTSETKTTELIMMSENVLDSISKVSVNISLVRNTQELNSKLMEAEGEEKQEEDIVLMAATKKDEEEEASLFMQTTPPPPSSVQIAVINHESELSVTTGHILVKDIVSAVISEEDIKTDKVPKYVHSFVAKSAETDANLENSAECWNESLSSKDDDRGSLEKEKQSAKLQGDFSEYNAENSSAEELADICKVGRICDGLCVDQETLDEVMDESLMKSVQTISSERGCKSNALSSDFASLSPKEENVSECLEQDEMKALSQPTPINKAASNVLDMSSLFTTPERNLMFMEQLTESGKIRAADIVTQYNDEAVESHAVVFTTPEQVLLLGDSGLDEVGKQEEQSATCFLDEAFNEGERTVVEFHDESNIAASPLRQSSVGDFKEERTERNEEYRIVELHCESGTSSGAVKPAALLNSVSNGVENIRGNKAMEFYEESVVFTGLEETHELFGYSGQEKDGEGEGKKAAQIYEEAGLSTEMHKDLELGEAGWLGINNADESGRLEGCLLYGDSEQKKAVKSAEKAAAEFHDVSAVPNIPEIRPFPEESKLEEATKSEENKALELQVDCNNIAGANITAKSHDMSDVLTASESHSHMGDVELDEEENKDVELLGESNTAATCEESFVFISPERRQHLGNSEPHTAGKLERKEVEFRDVSAFFSKLETRLLLGESGQDRLDNGKSSSAQYKSHHATSTKVILKDDSVVPGSAAPDFKENTIDHFIGNIASKVSYSLDFSAGEETTGAEFTPKVSQTENGVGLDANVIQGTSKQSRENSPHVDSDSHFDFDTVGADTIMDAERNVSFSSYVLALPTKGSYETIGEISNHIEVGGTLVSEESGPFTGIQNQTNDAVEELAITDELIDAKLTKSTRSDSKTIGLPAEVDSKSIGENSSRLEVIGTCSMVSEKSTPSMDIQNHINDSLEEELTVTENNKADELIQAKVTKNVDSSGGSDVSGKKGVLAGTEDDHLGYNFEVTDPVDTAFEKDISIAPDESTLQKNRNEEVADNEILKREATPSPEDTLNESSESGTSSEKQVRREPILIYRTQAKPKRHDMKENAPNSKIVDNLNVTAPRTSKRQPLQDLRKN